MTKGWEIKRLGDVAKSMYGYTESASFERIGPKFLRITDIQEGGVNWETVPFCKISSDDLEKYKLSDGDIVFARTGASTGKSHIVYNPPAAVFASYLIKVHITDKKLLPDYLYLFFQTKTYWDKINAGISGSAQGGFNASKLAELEIPIPTISEQQRIVSILDEAFAALATAKAHAEKNLQNARELFESYLQGVFEKKGQGWEETTLGETCEFRNGQAHEQHIDENGKYILVNSKYISSNGQKGKRTNSALSPLFIGDIAFVMSDVPNGKALVKCFLVDENDTYTLNQRIGVIRTSVFDKEFLTYQFNRNKYLLDFDNGENQTNLRKNDILKCPLLIPPMEIQKSIVEKLDLLSIETQKLTSIYQQKIADIEELKKSLLEKAFRGEL